MRHTLREYLQQIADFLPWIPDWVFGIAAFIGIVAAGLALQGAVTRFLKKRPVSWHPFARKSWDKTSGLMRFMLYDGALNVERFIAFLRRLTKDAGQKVFLVVDNLKVHHAVTVKAWVASQRQTSPRLTM